MDIAFACKDINFHAYVWDFKGLDETIWISDCEHMSEDGVIRLFSHESLHVVFNRLGLPDPIDELGNDGYACLDYSGIDLHFIQKLEGSL